jgi:hypothetical protein
MKLSKLFVLTLLCVCLIAGSVFAQRLTGRITGTVSDADGASLPGVTVEISSPSLMGGVQSQITSVNGDYRFINLPPGTYTLVFKLEGFQTLERGNVKLSVGKTVNENIILRPATLEESITVTAAAPVVDATQSGFAHVYTKDDLEKLPAERGSYLEVIKHAPGMMMTQQSTSRIVAFGSNSDSNSWLVDGVEVSSASGGYTWVTTTQEAFEEIETYGLGAPAEYGSFTGAVVSVVTKSGGNSFSGSLSYYGQFDALTDDNNPLKPLDPSIHPDDAGDYPDSAYSYNVDTYYFAAFNLGGPILKDKLWFYGTFERNVEKGSGWNIYPGYATTDPANKGFFKLTAQLADRHRLAGYIYLEDMEWPSTPYSYMAPETLCVETNNLYSWNLVYTWTLSNDAFLDLKYAGYYVSSDYLPQNGDMDTSPRWDWGTGDISGGAAWSLYYWTMHRHQAHANLSYFADDFLGGDHEFKVGVQYYYGDTVYSSGYAGEGYYYDYYGQPYYFYQRDVYYVGSAEKSFGGFAEDSWKIGDRMTLNLGLRFDHINSYVPEMPIMDGWAGPSGETSPKIPDMIDWNSFSPRIGLVFSLTSDQKTLLKATYGRYHDKNVMTNWNYPGPNISDLNVFYYDWDREEYLLWYTITAEEEYTMDPDLKHPYLDLFSVGFERELLPDFATGLTLVYKQYGNLIGLEERAGIYEEVSRVSEDNGQTYTLFNQLNVGTLEKVVTNPSDYEQKYWGVMLTFKKRYSNNWMLNASLTHSKSWGFNTMGKTNSARQENVIYKGGDFGEDRNDFTNARGRMPADRPWILKVQAGYTFPWDILTSFSWIYQSGRPYLSFTGFRLNQGFIRVITEPRGENRLPAWNMLDFRLQKTFQISDRVRFHAIFDLWNVLNANTETSYSSYDMWKSSRYLLPSGIFYPRRLQIGLRLQF